VATSRAGAVLASADAAVFVDGIRKHTVVAAAPLLAGRRLNGGHRRHLKSRKTSLGVMRCFLSCVCSDFFFPLDVAFIRPCVARET